MAKPGKNRTREGCGRSEIFGDGIACCVAQRGRIPSRVHIGPNPDPLGLNMGRYRGRKGPLSGKLHAGFGGRAA